MIVEKSINFNGIKSSVFELWNKEFLGFISKKLKLTLYRFY